MRSRFLCHRSSSSVPRPASRGRTSPCRLFGRPYLACLAPRELRVGRRPLGKESGRYLCGRSGTSPPTRPSGDWPNMPLGPSM
jgi:hypothetical protein